MKKIITAVLSVLIAVSAFCATACSGKDDGSTVPVLERHTYQGTHIMNAPESASEYLVKNGKTDYVLVTPSAATAAETTAIDEFQIFFERATDIQMKIVKDNSDDEVLFNPNARRISIGDTSLVTSLSDAEKKAQLGYDKAALGHDGVRIAKKANTVYLLGGDCEGVVYAVYDFLQICFNYEFYYRNCIEIDTGVKNLKMREFDVTDLPDFATRQRGNNVSLFTDCWEFELESGLVTKTDAVRAQRRYRNSDIDRLMPIHTEYGNVNSNFDYGYHNIDYYVYPGCKNLEGDVIWNDKWRSDSSPSPGDVSHNGRMEACYTAHGDPEAYEDLVDACAEKVIYSLSLDKWQGRHIVGFTGVDGGYQCTCSACETAKTQDGGAYVGAVIRLANRIMEKVNAWKAENGMADYELKMFIFAYGPTLAAPVRYDDAKGAYVLANESCHTSDDVAVMLCTQSRMNSMYWADTMDGQGAYSEGLANIEKWGICTDTMFNWFYQGRYLNYASYYDAITFTNGDFYAYALNCGSQYVLNQGDWNGENITSFGIMNEYLFSKLMWDCSLDIETLCKNFFKAMYKDASDTMYSIFNDVRMHAMTMGQDTVVGESNDTTADYARLYPYKSYIEPLINKFEKALSEIESLKLTSPAEYELVRKRIETEYVAPLYLALNYYGNSEARPFDIATKLLYKERLQAIANAMGFKTNELSSNTALKDFADGI